MHNCTILFPRFVKKKISEQNNVHNVTLCPSQLTPYGYCNDYGLMLTISQRIWESLVFANLCPLMFAGEIEEFLVERPLINDLKTRFMPCLKT